MTPPLNYRGKKSGAQLREATLHADLIRSSLSGLLVNSTTQSIRQRESLGALRSKSERERMIGLSGFSACGEASDKGIAHSSQRHARPAALLRRETEAIVQRLATLQTLTLRNVTRARY
jgi:hypothetical protein